MRGDLGSRSDSAATARGSDESPSTGMALRRARWVDERPLLGKIGRYTVLGQVAGGGMGSVFVAQMRGPASFSRLVAIKCLHTRWLDDPKYVARFTTEVKLSTMIRHPNVVQTLDVVEDGGELFLVMDYVDGVTLAALLGDLGRFERLLPIEYALGIMSAVLRGLHAAHEAVDENGARCHIVHRDVSPQNIMVSRGGHAVVLDFGAAKAAEHSQHTAAGVLVGKLAYMAPEQVRGERSSPRTDVFAAGVVLWEALVGQRLFYDPGLGRSELLHALVLKPVARPSQRRPDVPRALDEVVKKALERNPERRFQTALEFAMALDAAGAALTGAPLGKLVVEVCAERLADKEAVLRAGLAAASEASASTPLPHALVLPARTFTGLALASVQHPMRVSLAWLGAAVLLAAGLWWSVDGLHPGGFRSGAVGRALSESIDPTARPQPAGDDPAPLPPAGAAPGMLPMASAALPPAAELAAPNAIIELSPVRRAPLRAAPSRRRHAEPARGAAAKSVEPRSSAKSCDPPTYVDAAGIRHFKENCL
jgi:tRNA A-37 threonylcarbamoyl transferase component Bud32